MVATSPISIGTRKSALALIQAEQVAHALGVPYQIVPIISSGDQIPGPLRDHGGKCLFTKEIDLALLSGEIDLAVHSMKDVETPLPDGLEIAAVPSREDPRDVLIYHCNLSFDAITKVGTSSLRRARQLTLHYPNIIILPCRGNIQTRLQKFTQGQYDGLVLAAAGLKRLGMLEDGSIKGIEAQVQLLDVDNFVPAPGQGALVVLKRKGDARFDAALEIINHEESFFAIKIERAVVDALNLTCHDPVGVYATVTGATFTLSLQLFSQGSELIQKSLKGNLENIDYLLKSFIDEVRLPELPKT